MDGFLVILFHPVVGDLRLQPLCALDLGLLRLVVGGLRRICRRCSAGGAVPLHRKDSYLLSARPCERGVGPGLVSRGIGVAA